MCKDRNCATCLDSADCDDWRNPGPYTFYSDPGHGWLAVPVVELIALGIAGRISAYSYRKGDTAYLEEDCDAGVFLRAKFGADIAFADLEQRGILQDVYQGVTPIRNYQPYYLD